MLHALAFALCALRVVFKNIPKGKFFALRGADGVNATLFGGFVKKNTRKAVVVWLFDK